MSEPTTPPLENYAIYKKKKKIIQFSNLEVTRNKIFQI